MRQFTYIGDHDSVTLWGIEFPRGVAVSVDTPEALKKLPGNSDFAESCDGVEIVPKRRGRPPKAK